MPKPLILIDVDGVLNPYAAKPTRRPDGYKTIRVLLPSMIEAGKPIYRHKPLRVWLNESHGPALLKLAADNDAELVWATTWEDYANEHIGPAIGLPELPVIKWGFKAKHWKFDAVLEYVGDRPFIWFDDDFHTLPLERHWFEGQIGSDARYALYFVDPRIGLTELDFKAADTWLKENNV